MLLLYTAHMDRKEITRGHDVTESKTDSRTLFIK